MNFFKRIWNYLFPEGVKGTYEENEFDLPLDEFQKKYGKPANSQANVDAWANSQKAEPKPHTQLFRKHQLSGKVYNVGKLRFRIRKKIGDMGEKLKYDIELI